jgi:hypothetical protein
VGIIFEYMRSSNVENLTAVARAETKEKLLDLVTAQTVEPYRDGQWGKSFKQGGILEWYNPGWDFQQSYVNVGTREDWMFNAGRDFDNRVMYLLDATYMGV